jgi:nucleoside phosphorylase
MPTRSGGKATEGAEKPSALSLPSERATSSVDLLLLAAFGPELAPLKPAFADSEAMRGRIGGLVVEARACGIGVVTSAARASLHLRETRPRAVLLLGTCGVYSGAHERALAAIGDVVVSRQIYLVDPSALLGHTEFPPAMAPPISADVHLHHGAVRAGAAPADIATTLGITVDDAAALRIALETGAQVEHLEAYGVATACVACTIPFAAVLGVANRVGSAGRQEWRSHHLRASAAAVNVVLTWIEKCAAEGSAFPAP